MKWEIKRHSWKTLLLFGVLAGLFNGLAIAGWDYFKGNTMQIELYLFQAVFTSIFIAIAFRNKVVKK